MTRGQLEKYDELKLMQDEISSTLNFWKTENKVDVCLIQWSSYRHDWEYYPIYTDSKQLKKELDNLVYNFLKNKLNEVNKKIAML